MFSVSRQTMSRTAVIIPALNEELSIGKVIADLPKNIISEIIVVDNGSTDRTALVAAEAGARVVFEKRRGYGSACLKGIFSLRPETDIVVFLDADYSDYPEDAEKIIQPILRNEADFVIGSRLLHPENIKTVSLVSRLGNQLACRLMRMFFGAEYTDLGPFRAIRRGCLDSLGMRDTDFGWTIEMQIKSSLKGARVTEVPVRYRKRIGTPKITGTFWGALQAFGKITYTIIAYKFMRLGGRV